MARILIVEDEENIRKMLSQVLENLDHEINTASDGNKAVAFLNENEIDLVITDIVMPNREGLETIQEIRANWPDVKIIAMSGGGRVGNMNYLDMAKKMGAAAVLKKPFSMSQLRSTISEILDRSMWRDE
jgi:DNA-binding NtrC family response regulator